MCAHCAVRYVRTSAAQLEHTYQRTTLVVAHCEPCIHCECAYHSFEHFKRADYTDKGRRKEGWDGSSRGCNYLIYCISECIPETSASHSCQDSRQRRCWFWGSLPHQMHQPVNPTNAISQLVHAVTLRGIYYKVFIYFFALFTLWYRSNLLLHVHYVGGVSRLSTYIYAPSVLGAKATSLRGIARVSVRVLCLSMYSAVLYCTTQVTQSV